MSEPFTMFVPVNGDAVWIDLNDQAYNGFGLHSGANSNCICFAHQEDDDDGLTTPYKLMEQLIVSMHVLGKLPDSGWTNIRDIVTSREAPGAYVEFANKEAAMLFKLKGGCDG